MITHAASGWIFREWNKKSPIYFTELVLVFIRFPCRNFSFYFVLVFWITIILVLVLWKRRPIILVLVLIFVTKITLMASFIKFWYNKTNMNYELPISFIGAILFHIIFCPWPKINPTTLIFPQRYGDEGLIFGIAQDVNCEPRWNNLHHCTQP